MLNKSIVNINSGKREIIYPMGGVIPSPLSSKYRRSGSDVETTSSESENDVLLFSLFKFNKRAPEEGVAILKNKRRQKDKNTLHIQPELRE